MLFYSVHTDAMGSKSPSTEPVNVRLRAILIYKDKKNSAKSEHRRQKTTQICGSVLFCVSVAISSKPINFGCRCKVS